ncbi:MAG: PepSY domain-containing protein [Synergistaceae bacterium]|nr:PepSY domain-containing protein [Synergistaceae bacterium]MBR0203730.1 PepSY domain-containing protein [Synergistaceae bacterium]
MSRKFKLLALLLVFVLAGTSTEALAARRRRRIRHDDSSHRTRRVELITPSEAQNVVKRQLGTQRVRFFGEPELKNKAHDYPVNGDYRPVYEMRCEAQGSRYNVDVDAITGQVLKLAYARR